jgi:hypothetical protein
MSDICSHTLQKPLAYFDPDSHSLKTLQHTLDLGLTTSSVTLPRSGTMRNGVLYERPTLEPLISATDFLSLLPTPVVNDMGGNKTVEQWEELCNKWKSKFKNNGHGKSLAIEIQLLPTPSVNSSKESGKSRDWRGDLTFAVTTYWGKYKTAIDRWEKILDRQSPEPTKDNKLNPPFVEWMMGYPQGWVDGMSRSAALKGLGNAIVPQQAAAAWEFLLNRTQKGHNNEKTIVRTK